MNKLKKNLFHTAAVALLALASGSSVMAGDERATAAQGGGSSSVVVANTAAQPVPTKDQGDPGLQPFSWRTTYSLVAPIALQAINLPSVPAGKRLVIDQVSGTGGIPSPGTVVMFTIGGNCGGQFANVWVPMNQVGSVWAVATTLKICVDPGSTPSIQVSRSSDAFGQITGSVNGSLSVYGHFVDLP